MKILLLNQFFWPDSAPTSQLLTDLTRELAARGHSITVLCGRSRYAGVMDSCAPSARIIRIPELRFARGTAARVLSYLSFLAGVVFHAARIPKPDVIVSLTTPPLLPLAGALLKSCRGARHYIWEMDVYPDVAGQVAFMRPQSPLFRILARVADFARKHADGIIALGECMKDRLIAHGVPGERISVAENWADGRLIVPAPMPGPAPLRLLYSGNLGLAHDLDTMQAALLRLDSDPRFHFTFAGGGSQRAALQTCCRDRRIANVLFQPYCSWRDLSPHLAQTHIGLVTQRQECLGSVVPSKIYALMAAARPVLFIGPREATPARIIRQFECGWHIDCGDVDGLFQLIHQLQSTSTCVYAAGQRGYEAFQKYYNLPIGTGRICRILERSETS